MDIKNQYTRPEEYLSDESFLAYARSEEPHFHEWKTWLALHLEKQMVAEEALELLYQIEANEKPVSPDKINKATARLRLQLHRKEKSSAKIIAPTFKKWFWAAASVLVIASAVFWIYAQRTEQKVLAADYGEITRNKLPDGTEVILNANSEIYFNKKWEKDHLREVWIKGEAFFHVKKTAHHDKFIVHTDAFDIEVTGTSFNVINNSEKSSVVLKEGSIIIHRKGVADIMLTPGESVAYTNNQLDKARVAKDDYMAWTTNKLVFDNTTMQEVAKMIEQHYGNKALIEDASVARKTITGIMPNNNLKILIEALNATGEFQIVMDNDTIIFKSK